MQEDSLCKQSIIQLLYQEHYGWLRAWINKKLSDHNGAADLAQDTFVSLLLKAELPVLREPRAYLSRVAYGLLVDHLRRRDFERAYLEALAHFSLPEVGSPESRALMLELLIRLDVLLDGLPPKVRSAFLLLQLEGMSYAEIATQLGVTTRTVGNYIAKAMLQCMMLLEE